MMGILSCLWRDLFLINQGASITSVRPINWKDRVGHILNGFAGPQICIPYERSRIKSL